MRPSRLRLIVLVAVIVGLGWLDYISGPDFGFSLFYLIPVVIAGWFDGTLFAVIVGALASIAWFLADVLWDKPLLVSSWNGFTRLAIFIGVGVMMSKLRADRERLKKANDELEAFTYSVSHDLRSPLLHVGSYTEMLARHATPVLDATGTHYLTAISDASSTALTLIDDLLDFAHVGRDAMRLSAVDLSLIVEDLRREFSEAAGDRTIRWQFGSLPTVRGDAAMLRVALHNLFDNAVKYTRPRAEALIEVGSYGDHEQIVVYVRDNGVGFDQQYEKKLFRVFERLHGPTEFEGTGIGLAIVNRIVARHGGATWAEGKKGEGATFYMSLPTR